VIDYWDSVVLTPEMRDQIGRNPRAQMYMDSLELSTYGAGGLFWGRTVAEEFRTRRGYDIAAWLPFLTRTVPMMAVDTIYNHEPRAEHRIMVEKVRFDYVRTLTDLYIENMLRPFAAFLHEFGIALRSEISYGLPFELTRPGPEVDGIETESLEFGSQIDAYRLLAGPAHLFGKQYSSETGATTRNHMLDHRFYDQTTHSWVEAAKLLIGDKLTTDDGTTVTVEGGTTPPNSTGDMWDITVPGDHDFYVLAGTTPVLVHNKCFDPAEVAKDLPEYVNGGATSGRAVTSDGRTYDVVSGEKKASSALLDIVNARLRQAGRLPGRSTSARASDAEQKFAAMMWRDQIDDADLVINNPSGPCKVRLGCNDTLTDILGPNKQLRVHWFDPEDGWRMTPYGRR